MGRPKSFSREEVLEKAMPVFWKHGFADTSLQELERATGVNKSGLYTEFRDKEDLFVACLPNYLESQKKRASHQGASKGWNNVETFLKNGPLNKGKQQGCFSVNSMREFAIENLRAVNVELTPADLREMETALSKIEVHGGRMNEERMKAVDQTE
jgi:hypothetical protein